MREKKYAAPTKYSKADYGAVWEHETDLGSQFFIQTSKDIENPKWMDMGDFLTYLFEKGFHNPGFVLMMMRNFEFRQELDEIERQNDKI